MKAPDETAEGEGIACTANEEQHSPDTVARVLFSAVKLSNGMFRSSPKGLHSDKSTAQMTCQWKMLYPDNRKMATMFQYTTYCIPFPAGPLEKQMYISNK